MCVDSRQNQMSGRSYTIREAGKNQYYLYLTVRDRKDNKQDNKDHYLGKYDKTDERVKLTLQKKKAHARLKELAEQEAI